MALELHNYILREQRLVQIETQANHVNGVLDVIQGIRKSSDLDWEDILSAYYECDEDGTITFYEGESAEEGSPGIWTYMFYDCATGEEEVVESSNIENRSSLTSTMQIPNAENAVVDIRKLRDYCLSLEHEEGKHKARLFLSALGITADNAEELRQLLLQVVKSHEARLGRRDEFGQRYTIDFSLEWQNRSAIVRSGWIIEHDSKIPRLTTCYPL
jgi:hypothetical protein